MGYVPVLLICMASSLSGTNLKHTKAFNDRIVLDIIRQYGPLSRAQVARRSALTAQTISNITRRLLDQGLIVEGQRVSEGRGAPATLLSVKSTGAYAIGLDLDRDHATGMLMDLSGQVVQRRHHDLDFPSPDTAVTLLAAMAHTLLKAEGLTIDQVWGVGVCVPGPLTYNTDRHLLVSPSSFPGWERVALVDALEQHLDWSVYLERNDTAAAVGEYWYGVGRGLGSFFYVFLGSGLGGGFVLGGQPITGHTGNASGIGYTPWRTTLPPSDAAAFGIPHIGIAFDLPRLYRQLAAIGVTAQSPHDVACLLPDTPLVHTWLDEAAEVLAGPLLTVEYLLDPEALIVGGRWPSALIDALLSRIDAHQVSMSQPQRERPALLRASVGEDAAVLGAATLAMHHHFAPSTDVLMKATL
ncbi:MAG: ROK family protein [Rhodothermales bacterium]